MNFTAQFMTFRRKKVLDEIGNEIPGLYYSSEKIGFSYNKPFVIYDILDKDDGEKSGASIKIDDLAQVEKLGFVVCSMALPQGQKKWYSKQKTMIKLFRKNDENHLRFRKLKVIAANKEKHYIEYDTSNNRLRIVGIRSSPDGFSGWEQIK